MHLGHELQNESFGRKSLSVDPRAFLTPIVCFEVNEGQ